MRQIAGRLAVLVVVVAVGTSCSSPSSEPTGEPVVLTDRDAGFVFTLQVASTVVDAGEPIAVSSQLTWEGAAPSASIWGSGGGPVAFGLEHLDGPLDLFPAMTADCAEHEYARMVPVAIPYTKSGGYSGDDPNAAWYKTFFADPVLRLPAGRWRLTAGLGGYLAPCDANAPAVSMTLETEILVR